MSFTTPLAFVFLLGLPYLVWLGRPVGRAARREWVSLLLRCLIFLALVLGLAGAQVVRAADELSVVYLVDVSDSMAPAEREAALAWVAGAIESLKPNDRAAVVLFGADALVERPLSSVRRLAPVTSVPQSLNTDIGAAIRLGLALLPAGSARRLVVLSDGIETMGDAAEGARLAAASGVQIAVYPLGEEREGREAMLTMVAAPTRLTRGDRFDLTVTVESRDGASQSGPYLALLRVLGDGGVAYEESVSLSRGENRFTIPLQAGAQGFARYRVQIVPVDDDFYQNNELAAYTEIVGPPQVLLVSPPVRTDADGNALPDESDQIALALLASGMLVERTTATLLPADLPTLSDYAAIVLVDVNAKHLTPRKMAALQTYVRDLGGGLVVIGGPESYAPGGYYRTPLEETLPVEMQLKDQERRHNLTMIFVIDKSGSMADTSVGGIPKVELAKEAVIRSLGLLGPLDRAGVVAFDESAFWVVPPEEVLDPDGLADQVGTIRASGGTDIYAGLLAVAEVVPDDPATLKHVILLTDGGASEAGNPELTEQMHEEYGVTLSVVAIGEGYAPWIQALPELGEGRFHFAYDPDTIPEIFTQETTLATRAYIIEDLFWPVQVQRHPILSGITAAPPLYGYIGTSPKETAQTILLTHQDDPLLAAWQYGLGKSVAWTSDATGRWAAEWVAWAGFPRFWEQAIRWSISQERGSNAEVEVELEGGQAVARVRAVGSDGSYLNGLEMDVRVVGPDDQPHRVTMEQVAPGEYRGTFEPREEGAYLIRVAGSGEGEMVAQTAGWVLGYSPEYQVTEPAHDHLLYLAGLTGGKSLQEPWESLAHDLSTGRVRRPIWHWLLLATALLLPLDVALRRLVIGRDDVARAWQKVRPHMPGQRARLRAPRVASPRSEQVSRLFEAKQRAASQGPPEPGPIPDRPAVTPPGEPGYAAPPPVERGRTEAPDGTLAGRLLDRKRKRADKADDG
jgi:uncharacterized membrane protein/secreted protein with Ig-like and vWFA domain